MPLFFNYRFYLSLKCIMFCEKHQRIVICKWNLFFVCRIQEAKENQQVLIESLLADVYRNPNTKEEKENYS